MDWYLWADISGVENPSGVCGVLFKGEITEMVVNAIPPAIFGEQLCILTLTGGDIKKLLETGFVVDPEVEGFQYIPAGIIVTQNMQGKVESIKWADGRAFEESKTYTVAIDRNGYTEAVGEKGAVEETELVIVNVVAEYLKTNSPVSPLEHSIK